MINFVLSLSPTSKQMLALTPGLGPSSSSARSGWTPAAPPAMSPSPEPPSALLLNAATCLPISLCVQSPTHSPSCLPAQCVVC